MTLADLRKDFLALLNRRDVTPTQINAWIQQASQRAQRLLRVPAGETVIPFIVGDTFDALTIPGDFLKLISLYAGPNEITRTDEATVRRLAEHTGCPRYFARSGGTLVIAPRPNVGEVITLTYLANAPDLIADTDSNWVSEIAPDVIINGAMRLALMFFSDARADMYEAEFVKAVADLNNMALEDELTNASVAPALNFYGDAYY